LHKLVALEAVRVQEPVQAARQALAQAEQEA
jgi:hypothetical protein